MTTTFADRVAAKAAQIKADRKAGIVTNNNNGLGDKVLTKQDNVLRGLSNFMDNSEAASALRKEEGVRLLGLFRR